MKISLHPAAAALFLASVMIVGGCKQPSAPAAALPAPTASAGESGQVSFWVATDTHYLDPGLQDGGAAFQTYVNGGDGKMLPYSDELMDALVRDANLKKPKFLILSGDLTNNGEAASHKKLVEKLAKLEKDGTQVYVVPGNHDILNPWARSFKGDKQVIADHITDKDFLKLYADYGYNEAFSRDDKSLSYAVQAAPGLWLLMIDSAQYMNNEKYNFPQTDGRILPETLAWMEGIAGEAKQAGASVITVMHHNLISHTSLAVSGFKLNNSQEAMKALRKDGLGLVLSGHIHMQDIRRDPDPDVYDPAAAKLLPVYDIATSAMAVNPHQYGAMTYDAGSHHFTYHTAAVNVEGWAKATGSHDGNLLNFRAYAEKKFTEESYAKSLGRLKDSSNTEAEKASMAEVMARLNIYYFAGTVAEHLDEIKKLPGYKLWEDAGEGFMADYIRSMSTEKTNKSNVSLELTLPIPN